MKVLNKTYPGGKQVLKDIWLSFLPGCENRRSGPQWWAQGRANRPLAAHHWAGEGRPSFTGPEAWAAKGAKSAS